MEQLAYSDDELAAMMTDLESDLVERKESLSDTEKARRTICAFANDLAGRDKPGVLFVGVTDEGECAGLRVDDNLLTRLANIRGDGKTLPIPSMDVERRTLNGCDVAVVTVQPASDPPVRYDGRVWVRVGPTVRRAVPEDERRLAERRRGRDVHFDLRPRSSAVLRDLDDAYVEREYIPSAIAADVLEENQRSLEDQMHALRLLVGHEPTNGALLAFGHDPLRWLPGAYVQFVRFDGTEITDPVRSNTTLVGQLEGVLKALSQLLQVNIETRLDIVSGPREQRFPDYPLEALRQLAFNAIMHRSYENTNAPTRLYWYADRVAIESPGGLYGRVTPEQLGTRATDYRNPLIAEIMHNLGFAQRFGYGIPAARRALASNGNPEADFDVGHGHVLVTLRPAR
ncbi:RNA-binding domain-containing protein [Candidatus Poriferisodalis sp.]|uniref:RNA-binding domain-containing protein n=1 Tax=Candidatus Poriferisodalis sp. TaxID=3101277 RepID=UPI003B0188E8